MKDRDKTKKQLINEVEEMRQRIAELGASEHWDKQACGGVRMPMPYNFLWDSGQLSGNTLGRNTVPLHKEGLTQNSYEFTGMKRTQDTWALLPSGYLVYSIYFLLIGFNIPTVCQVQWLTLVVLIKPMGIRDYLVKTDEYPGTVSTPGKVLYYLKRRLLCQ